MIQGFLWLLSLIRCAIAGRAQWLLPLLLATCCLLAQNAVAAGHRAPVRVLFVGNSLTNRNDLPAVFKHYAEVTHPGTNVETRMIAPDGETLSGHHERGQVEDAISHEKWDYVVFQEGYDLVPGYTLNGVPLRTEPTQFYAQQAFFSRLCALHGAKPVIFEVWSADNFAYVDYESMRAARDYRSDIAPVGRIWREIAAGGQNELVGPDKIHPNAVGTYLIAATIAETLLGPPKIALPAADLDAGSAEMIARVIHEHVRKIHAHDAFAQLIAPDYAPDEPAFAGDQPVDANLAGTWRAMDGGFRLSFGTEIRIDADAGRLNVALKDFFTSTPLEPEVRELNVDKTISFKVDTGSVHYTVKAVPEHGNLKVLTVYNPNKTHRTYRLVTYRKEDDAYFDRLHEVYGKLAARERSSGLAASLKAHYDNLPRLVDADTFRSIRQGFAISEWDPIMAGMYYDDHGNAARAFAYYEAAAELYPHSVDALTYYGKGLAAAGRMTKAREVLTQALGLAGGKDTREGAAIEGDLKRLGAN